MSLKASLSHRHLMIKVLIWVAVIICLSLISGIFVSWLPSITTPAGMRWMQLIQMVMLFLLPPLVMAYLLSDQPMQWLYLRKTEEQAKKWRKDYWLWAIGIMLVALPAINLLGHINSQLSLPTWLSELETMMKELEESANLLIKKMLATQSFLNMMANLTIMALLPAVAEELTFRGVLMRLLQPQSSDHGNPTKIPHLAIWVTAFIFSAVHFQFYGFLPRMLMGALFGYMMVWTGSIWIPMLMHFINNAVAVLLYFMAERGGWDMATIDAIGTKDTLWLGVLSVVVTCIGIYYFRRSTTINRASSRMSNGN